MVKFTAAIFFPTEDSALGLNVFLDNRLFAIAVFSGARMNLIERHVSFTDLSFRVVFSGIKWIDDFPDHENKKVDRYEQSKHGKQLVITDDLPKKDDIRFSSYELISSSGFQTMQRSHLVSRGAVR